ncbi:hypothetical protein GGR58DRAFT_527951 [Xylaria digitata]|nr:hypothetical protein GGR58DRAFT_527951 [Xylaria digitata]
MSLEIAVVDVDAVSEPDDKPVEGVDVSVAELDCPLVDVDESLEVVEAEPESDVESVEEVVVSVTEFDPDVDAALLVEVEPESDERVSVSLEDESLEVDDDVADPDPELVLVTSVDELPVIGSPTVIEVTSPVVELEASAVMLELDRDVGVNVPPLVDDASLVVMVPFVVPVVIGTVVVIGDPLSSVLVTVVRLAEPEDVSLPIVADSEFVEVIAPVTLLVVLSSVVLLVTEIVSVTGDPLESVLVTVVRLAGLEASSLLVADPEFVVEVLPPDSLLVVLPSTVLRVMGIVVVMGEPLVSVLVTVVRLAESEDVLLPVADPEFVEVFSLELPVWEVVVEDASVVPGLALPSELVVAEVLALSEVVDELSLLAGVVAVVLSEVLPALLEVSAEVDGPESVALPEETEEVSETVNVAVLEVSKVEVSEAVVVLGVPAEEEMVDPPEVSVSVPDELAEPDELVVVISPLVVEEETETSSEMVDKVAEEEVEVVWLTGTVVLLEIVVESVIPMSVLLTVDPGRELEDVDPDELGPLEEPVGTVKLSVGVGKVITGYDVVIIKGVDKVEGGQPGVGVTVVLGHFAEHRQAAR